MISDVNTAPPLQRGPVTAATHHPATLHALHPHTHTCTALSDEHHLQAYGTLVLWRRADDTRNLSVTSEKPRDGTTQPPQRQRSHFCRWDAARAACAPRCHGDRPGDPPRPLSHTKTKIAKLIA